MHSHKHNLLAPSCCRNFKIMRSHTWPDRYSNYHKIEVDVPSYQFALLPVLSMRVSFNMNFCILFIHAIGYSPCSVLKHGSLAGLAACSLQMWKHCERRSCNPKILPSLFLHVCSCAVLMCTNLHINFLSGSSHILMGQNEKISFVTCLFS